MYESLAFLSHLWYKIFIVRLLGSGGGGGVVAVVAVIVVVVSMGMLLYDNEKKSICRSGKKKNDSPSNPHSCSMRQKKSVHQVHDTYRLQSHERIHTPALCSPLKQSVSPLCSPPPLTALPFSFCTHNNACIPSLPFASFFSHLQQQ